MKTNPTLIDHSAIRNQLQKKLIDKFDPVHLEIIDQSKNHVGHAGNKGGAYFFVNITASCFNNVPLIQRHRLIYAVADELIASGEIHALQINAKTV